MLSVFARSGGVGGTASEEIGECPAVSMTDIIINMMDFILTRGPAVRGGRQADPAAASLGVNPQAILAIARSPGMHLMDHVWSWSRSRSPSRRCSQAAEQSRNQIHNMSQSYPTDWLWLQCAAADHLVYLRCGSSSRFVPPARTTRRGPAGRLADSKVGLRINRYYLFCFY